jgi:hypothetical protein
MNAEISAKLAAFTAALTMSCLIIASVAYLFQVPIEQRTRWNDAPPASLTLAGGNADAHQERPIIAEAKQRRGFGPRS